MIIRIMTEGQYYLEGTHLDTLNNLDNEIVNAVASENDSEFRQLLTNMLELVRTKGTPVPLEEILESDIVLPEPDITLLEAEEQFVGEGIVPG